MRAERNGYLFWGLLALFVGVPEVLAALSHRLKDAIPWPTISGLVGGLEQRHHWVALVVVAAIVLVTYREVTFHRPVASLSRDDPRWGLGYVVLTALVAAASGAIAASAGASKTTLGYAIYLPLALLGGAIPTVLHRVLAVPTLLETIELLRARARLRWIAPLVVALLVLLCFHLAFYPWPNVTFGRR
ncbi:MAG TPA: hypothetical protein VI408_08785 [Gaiellaceae bacterium]